MGKENKNRIVAIIRRGGIGVIATDTMYGLVGSALSKKSVERIYRVRKRSKKKPLIVLIEKVNEAACFGVRINKPKKRALMKLWPSSVSVIFPIRGKNKRYLHRGTRTLALRIPKEKRIRALIKAAGPLVAPSANTEGGKPATSIKEAKAIFGKNIDFYVDTGRHSARPSTVLRLERNGVTILRRGADFRKVRAFAKSLSED